MSFSDNLIIAPVVLPVIVAGLMLVIDGRSGRITAGLSVGAAFALLAAAVALMARAAGGGVQVYQIGNWPSRFGIVLALDRLSAMMLVLTAVLACAALVFSLARWHKAGSFFHPLFMILLAGLNGAFLTGDLFNLFVFFEIMLAASYGLALHGSGHARVKAGLHYVAVNLVASSAFLIGVSLIYGAAGSLNMADVAARIPRLDADETRLFQTGVAILGVAFLVKAAIWPLGFWLPATYAAAGPPVAAMFAIMTKVGVYAILRLALLFSPDGSTSAVGAGTVLFLGGVITIIYGMVGMLASQAMARLAGFSVLVSSGTLIAVTGAGNVNVMSATLYYLFSSTMAIAAFFLLVELAERGRARSDDVLAVTLEAYGIVYDEDSDDSAEAGVAVPAVLALLGLAFIACALLMAGLPPLSGFIAKFAMLDALLDQARNAGDAAGPAWPAWTLVGVLAVSGLATLIAMTRAGVRTFWPSFEREAPRVSMLEFGPVLVLLALCVGLTIQAGPAMRFAQETTEQLGRREAYIDSVLAKPVAVRQDQAAGAAPGTGPAAPRARDTGKGGAAR
ncbi:monovalent cation/H+ antiporter subunit D [Camelimonas abortus]|uniref:Monovalent cation/H+ antiporter subunit D n=1 Tax=Camelimonas abortus TaxID=1017184 RepID=A0ABV7LAJ7_9HYPH